MNDYKNQREEASKCFVRRFRKPEMKKKKKK